MNRSFKSKAIGFCLLGYLTCTYLFAFFVLPFKYDDNDHAKEIEFLLHQITQSNSKDVYQSIIENVTRSEQLSSVEFDLFAKQMLLNTSSEQHLNLTLVEDPFEHAKALGYSMARAFQHKLLPAQWCQRGSWKVRKENFGDSTLNKGLLYVRNPKTASSTLVGVIARISTHWGEKLLGSGETCKANIMHFKGIMFAERSRTDSLLFTSIRDPTKRALSRVFFTTLSNGTVVSYNADNEPPDDIVLKKLQDRSDQAGSVSRGKSGFQLNYISTSYIEEWTHHMPGQYTHMLY